MFLKNNLYFTLMLFHGFKLITLIKNLKVFFIKKSKFLFHRLLADLQYA